MEGSIICSGCGSSIGAGAIYCDNCGKKVERIASVVEPVSAVFQEPVPMEAAKLETAEVIDAPVAEQPAVSDVQTQMLETAPVQPQPEVTANDGPEPSVAPAPVVNEQPQAEPAPVVIEQPPVEQQLVEQQPVGLTKADAPAQPAGPAPDQAIPAPGQVPPTSPAPVPVPAPGPCPEPPCPPQAPAYGQVPPAAPGQIPPAGPAPVPAPVPGPEHGEHHGNKGPEHEKRRKGVGVGAYLLVSLLSLVNIIALFATALTAAITTGMTVGSIDENTLKNVADAKNSGFGFIDGIAGALPTVSNYVLVGIFGCVALIFMVLIFIAFSRRTALAFRTIGIDLMIVSLINAFGIWFLNTYGNMLGSLNLDCDLFTLLRRQASEWTLIISLGLIVVAIIMFIVASSLDGARYRKAIRDLR